MHDMWQARRHGETQLDRTGGDTDCRATSDDDGDAPQKTSSNPAHRRRALVLFASSPHGATEKLLVVAHGFDINMIAASSGPGSWPKSAR